jgi:DNA-binding XRE family transcriptional regulator
MKHTMYSVYGGNGFDDLICIGTRDEVARYLGATDGCTSLADLKQPSGARYMFMAFDDDDDDDAPEEPPTESWAYRDKRAQMHDARIDAGLSFKQLAQIVPISAGTLCKIETGGTSKHRWAQIDSILRAIEKYRRSGVTV